MANDEVSIVRDAEEAAARLQRALGEARAQAPRPVCRVTGRASQRTRTLVAVETRLHRGQRRLALPGLVRVAAGARLSAVPRMIEQEPRSRAGAWPRHRAAERRVEAHMAVAAARSRGLGAVQAIGVTRRAAGLGRRELGPALAADRGWSHVTLRTRQGPVRRQRMVHPQRRGCLGVDDRGTPGASARGLSEHAVHAERGAERERKHEDRLAVEPHRHAPSRRNNMNASRLRAIEL